jgi:hypothetical protein
MSHTQTLELHQLGTPGQKQHHSGKTSTRIAQQNFIEDINILKVLTFYIHISCTSYVI